MRKTIVEWVVTTLAVIAVLAVPSDVQSQAAPGTQMAVGGSPLELVSR